MTTATLTRKEAHAEGIKFLRKAFEEADQADAQFHDAQTQNLVEGRSLGKIIDSREIVQSLQTALASAENLQCEDCDKPIADCTCYYAKAVR